MRMVFKILSALLFIVSLMLAACSPGGQTEEEPDSIATEPASEPPAGPESEPTAEPMVEPADEPATGLEGQLWSLVAMNTAEGESVELLSGSTITAEFVAGQIAGSAGCNRYFGSYAMGENGAIQFGPLAMTEMYCAEPSGIMDQESQYLATLAMAVAYEVDGQQLRLNDETGQPFLVYGMVQPMALENTLWLLDSYNNGRGGVVSLLAGSEITAIFAEGKLSGMAGCNNYFADYQVDEQAISIGPAASTRKFCGEPEGIMDQENAYLAALGTATSHEIKADNLKLFTAEGALALSYHGPSSDPTGGNPADINEMLANLTYQSPYSASGEVLLKDGEYREPSAIDSAAEVIVRLAEYSAQGQLSAGQEATVVILVTTTGGSGTFFDLAVVIEQDGQPVNVASTYLGDRVQIKNLAIVEGEILLEMINQGPDDPMCCPSQAVVQTYDLQEGQLVLTSERVVGSTKAGQ